MTRGRLSTEKQKQKSGAMFWPKLQVHRMPKLINFWLFELLLSFILINKSIESLSLKAKFYPGQNQQASANEEKEPLHRRLLRLLGTVWFGEIESRPNQDVPAATKIQSELLPSSVCWLVRGGVGHRLDEVDAGEESHELLVVDHPVAVDVGGSDHLVSLGHWQLHLPVGGHNISERV